MICILPRLLVVVIVVFATYFRVTVVVISRFLDAGLLIEESKVQARRMQHPKYYV